MSSVENFKTAVVKIRDILRGPGISITGMDSMRHICLYLLSRYMTVEKVKSLEVPEKFAWETLIDTVQTKNGGVQKALDYFYHKEEDSLVNHFDRLFGTEKFSFDIKNPQKHKEILEILNSVNMSEVDCHMDILGWVYEQHLKTGSSAARDLGQFFTDRFICSYMVKLCSPTFKNIGVPESVCDPSMGTGGFLTAYIKYFKETYPEKPIDWMVQQKEIHGCDTDPKVAGVSRLNLFMETGGNRTTNLLTHDSLYGDLPLTGYDLILANMPFGLKGIKHAECCERVKNLKIRGTKSEPLFLQLMMVSLNLGGRCAVVVPDGMLVNNSSCHNDTRKYLLDNFELKRVIKMTGKFFMNTGIQPSILFFENTGKPTTAVEFWEVLKGDKGEITETMLLSVPREKFDDSCSLDLRRYQETDKPVANPAGFPVVKLGEIIEICGGKKPINDDESGSYNKYSGSKIVGKGSDFQFDGEYILTPQRQSIGEFVFVKEKFWVTGSTYVTKIKDTTKSTTKYVYYYLLLNNQKLKYKAKGVIPYIVQDDLLLLEIPLPPLEIQNQIVTTLDRIYAPGTTDLADTLKLANQAMESALANPSGTNLEPIVDAQRLIRKSAQMVADVKAQMVADVKAQMVAIMKSVGSRGFPIETISNKCSMSIGGTPLRSQKEYYENGRHIWVSVSELNNQIITDSKEYINDEGVKHSNVKLVKKGSVLMSFKLSIGKCAIAGVDLYTNEAIVAFYSNDQAILSNKYLYYYLSTKDFSDSGRGSIGTGSMNKGSLSEITIPLPPLDFQHSIINRLDALQLQVNAIESLQQQTEDNARFILDSYLNTVQ